MPPETLALEIQAAAVSWERGRGSLSLLSRDPLSLELWKPYDRELGGRPGNGSIVKGLVWPKHRVWCSTAKGTKRMTRVWRGGVCSAPVQGSQHGISMQGQGGMTVRAKKLEGQGRMVGGDDGEGERAPGWLQS